MLNMNSVDLAEHSSQCEPSCSIQALASCKGFRPGWMFAFIPSYRSAAPSSWTTHIHRGESRSKRTLTRLVYKGVSHSRLRAVPVPAAFMMRWLLLTKRLWRMVNPWGMRSTGGSGKTVGEALTPSRAARAMSKKSAGLLLFREVAGHLQVLLVHPGGPFWAKKDEGAWSIPKGEFEEDEDPLAAAKREFEEETGFAPTGEVIPLEPLRQPSGKLVYAWAMRGNFDPAQLKSNTFSMEWPPKSGRQQEFPEIDRAAWHSVEAARHKILKGQVAFLLQLQEKLGARREPAEEGRREAGSNEPSRQQSLFDGGR